MNVTISAILSLVCLCLAPTSCNESRASASDKVEGISQAVQGAAASSTRAKTTKIAFIDKEHGCACTQKRVDTGWSALQAALAGRTDIQVERIHVDTEEDKAAVYQKLRPMMALPAVYFLDAKGALNELLQGDLTAEQIAGILK